MSDRSHASGASTPTARKRAARGAWASRGVPFCNAALRPASRIRASEREAGDGTPPAQAAAMPSLVHWAGSSIGAVARIVAVFGPCRGVVREIDRGLLVGRGADAGLQLIDEKVSREHCRIEP